MRAKVSGVILLLAALSMITCGALWARGGAEEGATTTAAAPLAKPGKFSPPMNNRNRPTRHIGLMYSILLVTHADTAPAAFLN